MSKAMAEVIREVLRKGSYQMPGDTLPYETQAATIAAALTAAGFGPVQAARAEAWDEGRAHGARFPFGFRGLATDDNPYRTEASS